ncbi:MAG: alpha-hydroxy-acid oxidizing protein [bacterium]|nr:alpha-hydroxy-acid oxidizing protein [bacterium]
MVREFVDGGADDEVTLRANVADFADVVLQPKVMSDVTTRSQEVTVFGETYPTAVGLSPAGLARLVHRDGELAAARAAAGAGVVFAPSIASSFSIEEIAAVGKGPRWFQLYLWKDRSVVEALVERAKQAGCSTLCLTVDVPIVGNRRRDVHNGMSIPPKIRLGNALDAARHPSWLYGLVCGQPITFRNLLGVADGDGAIAIGTYVNTELINPSAIWDDFAWLRELWDGPLVVKGILTAEDARRAISLGADGIVVSNHGGRQLDGAPSSIRALDTVARADLGAELFLDGGVRTGVDVVRACALGARMVFVGRPWFWGLAVAGEQGVAHMLGILQAEIDRTLALLGCSSISELDRTWVEFG